ncbi:sigma-54-dependent Fis family transcriptional regulator [Nonomuraea sp. SYSU D8015]|uniref:sigma-54-dependent Fis family transcriptional regulator n=1 Tax=Nonomuraea sp. SYSU D8015 TaxID=2593644 RepID=UPI0016615F0C|nr:helix-turn-helix domain-containing protein [Nonomuraea sp. SYSU D8015]
MTPSDMTPTNELRPEIAMSWRRCRMSGLGPAAPHLRFEAGEVDRRSRLVAAARPVLEQLAEQLGDAGYCVILADRESRLVDVPIGARTLRDRLAALGVVAGGVFMEETTGTNSIATVYELRRGLAVHGEEHYLEPFKRFSCYGHPIVHPVTHRLEGVLDITCLAENDSPLLGPFLTRAVSDIEERLLQTARRAEQRMLAAFQAAAAGHNRPVLVLGEGVVLANPAAVELLDPIDHLLLRELAADLAGRGRHEERSVELSSGRRLAVRLEAVTSGADGVLFEFTDPRETRRATARTAPPRPGTPVYVSGAPGTGRTTTVRSLARDAGIDVTRTPAGREPGGIAPASETPAGRETGGAAPATETPAGPETGGAASAPAKTPTGRGAGGGAAHAAVAAAGRGGGIVALDASEAAVKGEAEWLAELDAAAAARPGLLLVEDAHLLPDACAVHLRRLMERGGVWIALTGAPVAELTGYAATLAAGCPARIGLPALRDRADELPALVRAMLHELGAGDRVRFTPAALAALAGHPWPGNLRELRTVLETVVAHRSAGDVTPRDLPASYQVSPRLRRMTPLERAEHDAIAAALREHDGNKLRAAQRLGISRTTLYNRMRALQISVSKS